MKIITGNASDIDKIKNCVVNEFKITEIVYLNGKIEIKSWEAKVKD